MSILTTAIKYRIHVSIIMWCVYCFAVSYSYKSINQRRFWPNMHMRCFNYVVLLHGLGVKNAQEEVHNGDHRIINLGGRMPKKKLLRYGHKRYDSLFQFTSTSLLNIPIAIKKIEERITFVGHAFMNHGIKFNFCSVCVCNGDTISHISKQLGVNAQCSMTKYLPYAAFTVCAVCVCVCGLRTVTNMPNGQLHNMRWAYEWKRPSNWFIYVVVSVSSDIVRVL